jgi:hypothetical protein
MTVIAIKQGDSIGLVFGLSDNRSMADWVCEVSVKTHYDQETPEYTATLEDLNDDDSRWVGTISSSETATWEPRRYVLLADLYNEDTGEAKEFEATVIVSAQGMTQE